MPPSTPASGNKKKFTQRSITAFLTPKQSPLSAAKTTPQPASSPVAAVLAEQDSLASSPLRPVGSYMIRYTMVMENTIFMQNMMVIKNTIIIQDIMVIKNTIIIQDIMVIKNTIIIQDIMIVKMQQFSFIVCNDSDCTYLVAYIMQSVLDLDDFRRL
jgi:hypothetical protein